MIASILRDIISRQGRLPVPIDTLGDDADLFEAGLDSLAVVNVMLAIEDRLDVAFREDMLVRSTFASIGALTSAVTSLKAGQRAA